MFVKNCPHFSQFECFCPMLDGVHQDQVSDFL